MEYVHDTNNQYYPLQQQYFDTYYQQNVPQMTQSIYPHQINEVNQHHYHHHNVHINHQQQQPQIYVQQYQQQQYHQQPQLQYQQQYQQQHIPPAQQVSIDPFLLQQELQRQKFVEEQQKVKILQQQEHTPFRENP